MIVAGLRAIQERLGYLPDDELTALSRRLGVPLYRLHELITFFPHFRRQPAPAVCARVCRDLACRLRGSRELTENLRSALAMLGGPEQAVVEEVSCLGQCDGAPAVYVELNRPGSPEDCHVVAGGGVGSVAKRVHEVASAHCDGRAAPHLHKHPEPGAWWIDPYSGIEPCASEPYAALREFAASVRDAAARGAACDGLLEALRVAELRGMGGAGKPAVLKWSEARRIPSAEKYVVCNADESEPATFKDRELLLRAPYLIIEGMALAALLIGAERGFVYIRHEYHEQIEAMRRAIEAARARGVLGVNALETGRRLELEVFISPGGYVCGEQGALMEAIEERRAEPRNRPPEPETNGLYDKPTVLNNVETFAWVPAIMLRGADWYAGAGVREGAWYQARGKPAPKGMRFFSVCGDVAAPGVFEVPIGLTLGELIDLAGGMRDGLPLKAVATSGPSGGFVPARLTIDDLPPESRRGWPEGADVIELRSLPLDIDAFRSLGLMLGAGLVVYADAPATSMLDQAFSATRFFRNESCGKCVPCRVGSQKALEIAEKLARGEINGAELGETRRLLTEMQRVLELTSICGLGMSVAKPLTTVLQSFWRDLGQREPIS